MTEEASGGSHMKEIGATKAGEQFLELLDQLGSDGILITKEGKAVARLMPVQSGPSADLIGKLKSKVKVKGEIMSTGLKWNAES